MTINPSVGAGLGVCTPAQYAAETAPRRPAPAARTTRRSATSRSRARSFSGSRRAARSSSPRPYDNPFGTLIAIYLVAKAPERGILVKVAGQARRRPGRRQPHRDLRRPAPAPLLDLDVHFREGQRSPLATPPPAAPSPPRSTSRPGATPAGAPHRRHAAPIDAGVGGGPCPAGTPPFAPEAQGGSSTPTPAPTRPSTCTSRATTPNRRSPPTRPSCRPGSPANSPASPSAPRRRSPPPRATQRLRRARPSLLPGGEPDRPHRRRLRRRLGAHLRPRRPLPRRPLPRRPALDGRDRLGHGRPLRPRRRSSSARRSRSTRRPPRSRSTPPASDPIPHIIDGIPIHLRDIRVYIDRPSFTLNPTSCEPFAVASTLTGSGADASATPPTTRPPPPPRPTRRSTAPRSASSRELGLRLQGGTRRGELPVAAGRRAPAPGRRQHRASQVTLPPSLFLDQATSARSAPGPSSPPKPARRPRSTARPGPSRRCSTQPLEGQGLPALLRQPAARPGRRPSRRRPRPADRRRRADRLRPRRPARHLRNVPDAPVTKFVLTLARRQARPAGQQRRRLREDAARRTPASSATTTSASAGARR